MLHEHEPTIDVPSRRIALPVDGAVKHGEQDLAHVVAIKGIAAIKSKVHQDPEGPPQDRRSRKEVGHDP